MEGEGQYVGDEASEWFSKYMNKPGYKMYKLSRTRVIRTHDEWSDIGEAGDQVMKQSFFFLLLIVVNVISLESN